MRPYYLAFLLLFSVFTYAQDIEEEQSDVINQERFITLSQISTTDLQNNASRLSQGTNAIFIQQIGANNTITSRIQAQSSNIRLIQNGDDNSIEIDEASREIEKLITQNGNNNSVVDFSFNPDASTSLELTQEGSNLIFERFGTNELSKNLKFTMSGNARTITIRSF